MVTDKVSENESLLRLILELWGRISKKRKIQFYFLLLLMILSSIAEVMSIGALFPFLAVIADPKKVSEFIPIDDVLSFLGVSGFRWTLLIVGIIFCLATVFSAAMRMLASSIGIRLAFATGADLGAMMYRSSLYQPYIAQISKSTSETLDGVLTKSNQVTSILFQSVSLISSLIMLMIISVTLLYIDPYLTAGAFLFFGLFYALVIFYVRNKLKKNSINISQKSKIVIKAVQEGLGGIREVIIYRLQEAFVSIFITNDQVLRFAQGQNQFISACPRFIIEPLSIIIFSLMLITLAINGKNILEMLPLLATLIMGAQKILPLLQNIYANYAGIKGGEASLAEAMKIIKDAQEYKENYGKNIVFDNFIKLNNVSYRYPNSKNYVLENITLKIKKGSKVGIIGRSGSGKSTLVDIIMGLLQPHDGTISVDNSVISSANLRYWQNHIAHVPQSIFLIDGTVVENIAFGEDPSKLKFAEVKRAAEISRLAELIQVWPHKYNTMVGERGIKISGGQRQRLGLARALYKRRNLIVLDEATSALDGSSESEVMNAIEKLDSELTVIMIAHRLSSLKICDWIFEIKDGRVFREGSYQEIIGI
jgi:ABC-type multidrug transport system fused ATPase/permease subunit